MLFVKYGNCCLVVTVITVQQECLWFSSWPEQNLFRWTVGNDCDHDTVFDLGNQGLHDAQETFKNVVLTIKASWRSMKREYCWEKALWHLSLHVVTFPLQLPECSLEAQEMLFSTQMIPCLQYLQAWIKQRWLGRFQNPWLEHSQRWCFWSGQLKI